MYCNEKLENISGIYIITNLVNDKVYIGSTVDLYNRHAQHKSLINKGIHPNKHLQNAWNKYGKGNFLFSVLELVPEKEKLIEREQYWMDKYSVIENGYNINPTAGSSLGRKGIKLSNDKRKEYMLSQKSKPILQFDVNGNFIKEWYSSGEIARELDLKKDNIVGVVKSKNKKMNNCIWIYKNEFTDEKLQECINYKPKTNPKPRKILQLDMSGNFIRTWESISLAARTLGIHATHIVSCCQGNVKQTGGYSWVYAN